MIFKLKNITELSMIYKIIGIIPVLGIIIWFIYIKVNGKINKSEFYKQKISTIVIESNDYYGRSRELILNNGLKLYFMPPLGEKIAIGDSIYKEKGTYLYKVFRKNNTGNYDTIKTYDFRRIY